MIVDYGLNTTSVRKVSIHRNTIEMLSKTFTTTLSLKIVMSGFCFIILLFSCFFLELKKDIIYFYINSFLFVVGSAIIPTWFFQGLERMNFVFILNFFAKFFFFIFIFIGIRTENDYNFVLLFWGLGTTLSGILGLVIIKINYQLIWHLFNVRNMIEELKEGFPIFVSNISTLGLTQSNIIILNRFTDDVTVGYFSIAEIVIGAVWQILSAYSKSWGSAPVSINTKWYLRACRPIHLLSLY
jgi:PST family polysaccharide transporter